MTLQTGRSDQLKVRSRSMYLVASGMSVDALVVSYMASDRYKLNDGDFQLVRRPSRVRGAGPEWILKAIVD